MTNIKKILGTNINMPNLLAIIPLSRRAEVLVTSDAMVKAS
jgi:hypothetical protein